jgi:hypothetical protein
MFIGTFSTISHLNWSTGANRIARRSRTSAVMPLYTMASRVVILYRRYILSLSSQEIPKHFKLSGEGNGSSDAWVACASEVALRGELASTLAGVR